MPDESPLVARRGPSIAEIQARMEDGKKELEAARREDRPPVQNNNTESSIDELVLIRAGFPRDYWLPANLARKWKSDFYPVHRTREAVEQWRAQLEEAANWDFARGRSVYGQPTISEMVESDLANDLELLRQFDSSLVLTVPEAGGEPAGATLANGLKDVEKEILKAVARKTLKGETIASKTDSGYSYDYVRRFLPGLVKRGYLKKVPDGYRKIKRPATHCARTT